MGGISCVWTATQEKSSFPAAVQPELDAKTCRCVTMSTGCRCELSSRRRGISGFHEWKSMVDPLCVCSVYRTGNECRRQAGSIWSRQQLLLLLQHRETEWFTSFRALSSLGLLSSTLSLDCCFSFLSSAVTGRHRARERERVRGGQHLVLCLQSPTKKL